MTTYRKRLKDKNGDTIIPALSGDETKWIKNSDIGDGVVKSDNIDWTTIEQYSTEEVIIGKWIDGKVLYRRVVNTNSPTEPEQSYVVGVVPNNISITKIDGILYYANSKLYIPINCYFDTGTFVATVVDNNNIYMKIGTSSRIINQPVSIVLEYTKNN